jgi:SET domain-containing protein
MTENILVKESKIHRKGIFANKDFKKGETVFVIKGEIVHWEVKDEESSLYGPNWVGISKNTWIDPKDSAVFLNHSCEPSCGIKGRVKITALKDIKKGEEITIDYSITEMDTLWHMDCNCGSKTCRKHIRSIQFLPKKIYNKYVPYIPSYFMKVYGSYSDAK